MWGKYLPYSTFAKASSVICSADGKCKMDTEFGTSHDLMKKNEFSQMQQSLISNFFIVLCWKLNLHLILKISNRVKSLTSTHYSKQHERTELGKRVPKFSPLTPKWNIGNAKSPLVSVVVLSHLFLPSVPFLWSHLSACLAGWWLTHPPCLAGRLCSAHIPYASICIIKKKKKKKSCCVAIVPKQIAECGRTVPVPLLDFFICFLGVACCRGLNGDAVSV